MSEMISLCEVKDILIKNDDFVVFCHANADADTIGSGGALVEILRCIGKKAVAFCPDGVPERINYLTDLGDFASGLTKDDMAGKCLVSVDIASYAMLGSFEQYFINGELSFALSIDHHEINSLLTEKKCVFANYISNGEIIYELAKEMNVPINRSMATLLFSAICSDSGGFKYQNTRPETYEYAAQLIRAGADFNEIFKQLFERKTKAQFILEKKAYENLTFHYGGKLCILYITKEAIESSGADSSDIDSLNQIPRLFAGVEVSAVIKPNKEEGIKVSLRSNDFFDVAALAKKYGGGGHIHAAAFRYKCTEQEAKEMLIKELEAKL